MPKKLIDIYPPKKIDDSSFEEALSAEISSSRSKSFGLHTKKLLWGFPVLLIPFAVLHFFFSEAQIRFFPQITEMHIEEQVIAQVGQANADLGQKLIPAKFFAQEKEAKKTFPATGKEVGEEKSSGTIRVFNESQAPQTLVANTRFISENGEVFRLIDRVSVPGMQNGKPGFLDVTVQAAEVGPDYNIGASTFSLPGLAGTELYTNVYGRSTTPMIGGAIGEFSVVTSQDIDNAKQQLLAELEVEAMTTLLSRIPPNFVVLEGSREIELLQDNSLVQAGAALREFTYTASVQVSILAFAKEDALLLARHLFGSYLTETQVTKDRTFEVGYTLEASNIDTGRMVLSLDISSQVYTSVDAQNLRTKFLGASRQDALDIAATVPSLASVEFSLWPFWVSIVPKNQDRVEAEISL